MSEEERLQELYSYNILDTTPEKELNDIVQLASMVCNTPIAQITLIDNKRQWIKASYGMNTTETSRDDSFCTHAIEHPRGILEVEDSHNDERFKNNFFVTGETGIRFYAGAPLVTPKGFVLGTLCVIDRQPGKLSEREKDGLRVLSERVMHYLEVRRINVLLKKQLSYTALKLKIADSNSDDLQDASALLESKYLSALEAIIFSVSHSVRAPITTLEGLIYLLSKHEKWDHETIADYVERIKAIVSELNLYTSNLTRALNGLRNEQNGR